MNSNAWHRMTVLLASLLISTGCSGARVIRSPAPTEPQATPSSSTAQATLKPGPTSTPTPDPFPDPVLQVMGEAELVYDWSSQRCSSGTIPDLPVRAFRDARGQVQLILSHTEPVRMVGPDLDQLQMDCKVIHGSSHDPDPASFSDNEWIASTYTQDGETVYALVHDEYHGQEHPGQCPSGEYFNCWYNAVTLFISTDGGASYRPAAEPPGHLVASWPLEYIPDGGIYGMFSPSNIIQGLDGAYYTFLKTQSFSDRRQSVCLMRTADLSDPSAWRFWDGSGFVGRFVDPYREPTEDARGHVCPPLALDEIGAQMIESVTYNEYLGRYVLVGISADFMEGREV
jgi:hypothetical protein